MGFFKSIKSKSTQFGAKKGFQYGLQECIGVHRQQEQIDTLFYFLSEYVDPSQLPPTKDPDLRIMQLCDAYLLQFFDKVCQKYNLAYWLDWGTLLGAVRHHGFVPWDDDTDVSMPREDYDKLLNNIPPEFKEYGIGIVEESGRLCISYKHHETGIWIDVFPAEKLSYDTWDPEKLQVAAHDFRKKYKKLKSDDGATTYKLKKECFHEFENGKSDFYVLALVTCNVLTLYTAKSEDIFPLKKAEFEGISLNVPNDCDAYLNVCYGPSYMKLPKSGVLQHGIGRTPLSTWAKAHGVDMYEVCDYLKGISEKII